MLNNTEYINGVNKELLFEIMLKEKVDFEVAGIINMLDISKSDNKKIQFYLMYKDELLEVYEIDEILQRMGGKFIRILNKENHTYLDNTIDNCDFIDHLIDKGVAERKRPTRNLIQIVFGNTR